jgi:cobalt-zinc-cadmium efflux system outer membrane protein
LALALAGAGFAFAPALQARDLTLEQAVSRSLDGSAVLQAEGAAVTATRYQAELDALAPPLTIGMELENVAGTGDLSGTDSAETTLRLGRVFELGHKQTARESLGAAQVAQQLNAVEQRRLDVAAAVTHRFIDVLSKQARLELAAQNLDLAEAGRGAIAYRVERSRSPLTDLHLADLAVLRAELEREDANHELASARVALSVLWGEQHPDFRRVAGQLLELPAIETFDRLVERLPRSAAQQAFVLEAQQLDAQERLASSARMPDVHTSLGVRRLESIDDEALVLSFSLPLGTATRSALALDRQRAERERLTARRTAAWLDSYQILFGQYEELQHARHHVETLRDRMIPLADKTLAAMQAGYEETRFSFLQVAQARAGLLDLHRDAIDAATRYHRLLADIERATAMSGDLSP